MDKETRKEIFWGLAVLLHLMILSNLFYGPNLHWNSDPTNWNLSKLVAASAIWLYLGVFHSSFTWRRRYRSFPPLELHRNLAVTLYALATTLPTLSAIFSCLGLGSLLWDSQMTVKTRLFNKDMDTRGLLFLATLYSLNLLCLFTFSRAMGLWGKATPPPRTTPAPKSPLKEGRGAERKEPVPG